MIQASKEDGSQTERAKAWIITWNLLYKLSLIQAWRSLTVDEETYLVTVKTCYEELFPRWGPGPRTETERAEMMATFKGIMRAEETRGRTRFVSA